MSQSHKRYIVWKDPADDYTHFVVNREHFLNADQMFREWQFPEFTAMEGITFTDTRPVLGSSDLTSATHMARLMKRNIEREERERRGLSGGRSPFDFDFRMIPTPSQDLGFPYRLPPGMDIYRQRQYRRHVPAHGSHGVHLPTVQEMKSEEQQQELIVMRRRTRVERGHVPRSINLVVPD